MTVESEYYAIARLQERLAQETGDLDLTVKVVGGVVCITGTVSSQQQRDRVTEVAHDAMPDCTIRNETTLPRVTETLPPETIER